MSVETRVSNWLNTETLAREFGVEVKIDGGGWRHLAENNVAFVTGDFTAANRKAKEVRERLEASLAKGGEHARD